MKITRRWFIAAGATAAAAIAAGLRLFGGGHEPAPRVAGIDRRQFEALVDTIVPADDAPGALAAGVAQRLLERFAREPWRAGEYRYGMPRLEALAKELAGRSFVDLDLAQRTRVLAELLRRKGPDAASGRILYVRARSDVLKEFYASPTGQKLLGYRPPLNGYPDYAAPLRRTGSDQA
jgi:hypothetical protein